MDLCDTCWRRWGRSLSTVECLCTPGTTVLHFSAFHAWMGKKVPQLSPKIEAKACVVPPPPPKPKLVFGSKPETPRRKRK